jgi:hypothetical protein
MINNHSLSDIFTDCLIRDNHTCQDCGSLDKLEIHHIVPVSQGGKNTLDNMKTVCHDCHVTNYKDVHYPKDKSKIIPYGQRERQRYGIDKSRFTQIGFSLPDEIMEQVKEYRSKNSIKFLSEAIRELVQIGIEKEQSE